MDFTYHPLRKILLIIGVIGLLFTMISGCSTQLTEHEFGEWFANPENGYLRTRNIEPLSYRVKYQPPELLALRDISKSQRADLNTANDYNNSINFILEIGWDGDQVLEGSPMQAFQVSYDNYKTKVQEFAFGMDRSMQLVVDKDTISPVLTHFERGYELSKSQKILIAFPRDEDIEYDKFQFVFRDKIFKTGLHKFNFSPRTQGKPTLSQIIKPV